MKLSILICLITTRSYSWTPCPHSKFWTLWILATSLVPNSITSMTNSSIPRPSHIFRSRFNTSLSVHREPKVQYRHLLPSRNSRRSCNLKRSTSNTHPFPTRYEEPWGQRKERRDDAEFSASCIWWEWGKFIDTGERESLPTAHTRLQPSEESFHPRLPISTRF